MDIYRYFHPHHNPRLRTVPVRLQELGELEQAALELKRAIERAELRAKSAPAGDIVSEHFSELTLALTFVVDNLRLLTQAHPGDKVETLTELWEERRSLPGWETWARIVRERLTGPHDELFEEEDFYPASNDGEKKLNTSVDELAGEDSDAFVAVQELLDLEAATQILSTTSSTTNLSEMSSSTEASKKNEIDPAFLQSDISK